MRRTQVRNSRLHDIKDSPSNEAEVQAVLAAAKASEGDAWNAVRLLAGCARCTLQAGRGHLALPLIVASFELSPEPFRQLVGLQQLTVDGSQQQILQEIAENDAFTKNERGANGIMSTVLIVWHGVVVSVAQNGSCPKDFLRFSHCIAHLLSLLPGADGVVHEDLSACWLYNIIMFAHKCKCMKAVAHYLLEGMLADVSELPEDLRDASTLQSLPFAFRKWGAAKAFVHAGVRKHAVATMFKRLCLALYTEGCDDLRTVQREIDSRALAVTNALQQTFGSETSHYMVDFHRPLRMEAQHIALLCQHAMDEDQLCTPRGQFGCIRLACLLKRAANKIMAPTMNECKLVSLSSVVALALRHQYIDIAAEILQTGVETVDPSDESLLLWGKDLELVLAQNLSAHLPAAAQCPVKPVERARDEASSGVDDKVGVGTVGAPEPTQLLHEVVQGSLSDAEAVRVLALADDLTQLLPIGLTLLRGRGTLQQRLLADKIAVPFVIGALARLVQLLVNEGDMPLVRCFLPFIAHLCVGVPSRAHLLFTLQAIAAFAKGFPGDTGEWASIASALSQFSPLRSIDAAPSYCHTKAITTGRTFASRRRVFDALRVCRKTPKTMMHSYCQVQVSLLGEGGGVRLLRTTHVRTTADTRWEKVLQIEYLLLQLVEEMKIIERRNRDHLRSTDQGESPLCEDLPVSSLRSDISVGPVCCSVGGAQDARKAREEWWNERRALDRSIGAVVQSMQSPEGFGCWRAALCGELPDSCQVAVWDATKELLSGLGLPAQHEGDVSLVLAALPFVGDRHPEDGDLLFNPSHVGPTNPCGCCDETLRRLSTALEQELITHLDAKLVNEPTACRKACLHVLTAMHAVISEKKCNQPVDHGGEPEKRLTDGCYHVNLYEIPRTPVYLVLDNELHCLPFEGIDVLRHGSVSRVPTVSFVSTFTSTLGQRNDSCHSSGDYIEKGGKNAAGCAGTVCCVIDPAGVMSKTLRRLLPLCSRKGWVVKSHNSPPSARLLREMYRAGVRLYVYVGHGKGEQIIQRGELYERVPDPANFPSVFLMGCSSAYMDGGLTYDCYGMPYAFLHAGAPLFVGCLWHVTDGEIDRLTKRLLSFVSYGGGSGDDFGVCRTMAAGEALRLARKSCKLPYLTGCATVLYGMNLPLGGTPGGAM
ncbi:cysteine peptidase, Clan CD, family C50, putative [Trypanosoma equiperdum]|uniref:separase n=1 Tax=Trypanosoma equiperdum TaxID=5694 RepID=A0A1G4IFJ6_TRYEQ|nr:cysteine peptidase, Clan CD, family C50, putative [Trypanosoma equiperdum]